VRAPLVREIEGELARPVAACPIVSGVERSGGAAEPVLSPHDHRVQVGTVRWAEAGDVEAALAAAQRAAGAWDRVGGPARAAILDKAADLYERDRVRLMAVMVREAGKTLDNALGDVREAVDFLRYYASEARRLFAGAIALPGPAGETNAGAQARRSRRSRPGISAIFTGQVAAARPAAPVLAKPAGRRRSWRGWRCGCCTAAYRRMCCISCPAPARSAPPSPRMRVWRASSSPAPTTRAGPSTRRWRRGGARFRPSSRKRAA
jgi:RHH-type proline utilization regulon transcriptional repressor/proline dehydrogenase/delta 1-pyrroline-5-carboxylate dehydrogenase